MKHAILIAALMMPLSVSSQPVSTPEPAWWEKLILLGELYRQWCEDRGGTYAIDDNHQLWHGQQWKCYDPEPHQRS